jgi:hypothetical protein
MADNFNSLPDDVDTLQKQLLEKERFIQDLILENLALKNSMLNETLEEQNVELEDDSEPITLKKFDGEDDEDDEENIPNLGENLDQTDFFNILKMLMRQEATGFQDASGEEEESVEEPLADETVD